MTTTATDTDLPPGLVDQVRGLTPDQRDRLRDWMDEMDEDGPPPEIDWAEIKQRSDDYHAGRVTGLTIEESLAHIRAEARKLGVELP